MKQKEPIRVVIVDDNPHVCEALRIKLAREAGFAWGGDLPAADHLFDHVESECPAILVLDIDMPGMDAFEAMTALNDHCPKTRTVMFSGHVRRELIDRAVEHGAWGYVSKNDGEDALVEALRRVASGEFALSPDVWAVFKDD